MKLNEFIKELVDMDLLTHPVSIDTFIAGNEDQLEKIIRAIQNALNDLYIVKMPMLTSQLHIMVEDDVYDYPLPDKAMRILTVKNHKGKVVPVNDVHRKDSVYTPDSSTLRVPNPVEGDVLILSCQGRPPQVTMDTLCEELPFPDWLKEAVRNYVVGQIYGSLRTQEGNEASQMGKASYLMAVNDLIRSGLYSVEGLASMNNFELKGWV